MATVLVATDIPAHATRRYGSKFIATIEPDPEIRKYAHLASVHLVQYVDHMSDLRLVQDGEAATIELCAAK